MDIKNDLVVVLGGKKYTLVGTIGVMRDIDSHFGKNIAHVATGFINNEPEFATTDNIIFVLNAALSAGGVDLSEEEIEELYMKLGWNEVYPVVSNFLALMLTGVDDPTGKNIREQARVLADQILAQSQSSTGEPSPKQGSES